MRRVGYEIGLEPCGGIGDRPELLYKITAYKRASAAVGGEKNEKKKMV